MVRHTLSGVSLNVWAALTVCLTAPNENGGAEEKNTDNRKSLLLKNDRKARVSVRPNSFQSTWFEISICKFKLFVVRCTVPSGKAGVLLLGLPSCEWATSPATPLWADKNRSHAVWSRVQLTSQLHRCLCGRAMHFCYLIGPHYSLTLK